MSSPTAKTRTWGYSLLARAATATNRKKWAIGFLAFSLQVPATLWAAADSDTDFGSRIINADKEPHNWLSHGRSYGEARYSPLNQINQNNVEKLGLAWFYDLDTSRGQEATPLVVDGVLYTSSAWSKVQAFDAATGRLLWQFDPKVPGETAIKGCCDVVNRGVAYWDGMVYVGALDGRLIAIDAKTGQQIWSTMTVDASLNYTITGAPRIVKGKVIIGNSGAEFGVRGYVTAYDAKSGDQVWRFYTVPGKPGEVDNAASDEIMARLAQPTWSGQWWDDKGGRGGGTVWDSMAYDSELDLLYLGVGNGSYWSQKLRSEDGGDNLFVSSILALRPDTGEYVWHFQQVPGDEWDYTATQHMILADLPIKGKTRKVLMQAPKNGFFYVIDRSNGEFISAQPYTEVNWATGVDPKTGRPQFNPDALYSQTGEMWVGIPGSLGAHNWQPMAFNPDTGLVYIPTLDGAAAYKTDPNFKPLAKGMNLGVDLAPFIPPTDKQAREEIKKSFKGQLIAWNPITQKEIWRVSHSGPWNGGVLTTAGGLVFQGEGNGHFSAYKAASGEKLWSFDGQSGIQAAPISYAVDGVQYISVMVGLGGGMPLSGGELLWNDGKPLRNKSRVLTFALNGSAHLPSAPLLETTPLQPPPQFADEPAIKRGEQLYHSTCGFCHGGGALSSGLIKDLRYSSALASQEAWKAIVYDGALTSLGMVSFKDNYSIEDIEAIRAYVISRAQATAAESQASD